MPFWPPSCCQLLPLLVCTQQVATLGGPCGQGQGVASGPPPSDLNQAGQSQVRAEVGPSPGELQEETEAPRHLESSLMTGPEMVTQLAMPGALTHRCCELVGVCCIKLLGLWESVMLQKITYAPRNPIKPPHAGEKAGPLSDSPQVIQ